MPPKKKPSEFRTNMEKALARRREHDKEGAMRSVFANRAMNARASQEQVKRIVMLLRETSFIPQRGAVKPPSSKKPNSTLMQLSSQEEDVVGDFRRRVEAGDDRVVSFLDEDYSSDEFDSDSTDEDLRDPEEGEYARRLRKEEKRDAKRQKKENLKPLKVIYGDDDGGVVYDESEGSIEGHKLPVAGNPEVMGSTSLAQHEQELLESIARHDELDPSKMAYQYRQKYIPNPPPFSSSSLSRCMESIVHDAEEITLSTEQLLRYITDPHQKHWKVGSLDGENARSVYYAQKAEVWIDDAMTHVPLYVRGADTIQKGAHDEVILTRQAVVAAKDDIDVLDRHWEQRRLENEVLRRKRDTLKAEVRMKEHALADDGFSSYSTWKQGCVRLRQLLGSAKSQLLSHGLQQMRKQGQSPAGSPFAGRTPPQPSFDADTPYNEDHATADIDLLITALAQKRLGALYERVCLGEFGSTATAEMLAMSESRRGSMTDEASLTATLNASKQLQLSAGL